MTPAVSCASAAPRRRRKDARPSELLAAALELFVEKGFAATRLTDVAAHAGVAKATLYLYFDSKEALFRAVVAQGIVPLFAAAQSELGDYSGSASDLLVELLTRWQREVGATPLAGLYKLIIAEANNFPELVQYYHDEVIVRGRAMLADVLRRGMASGEFREIDVDATIDVVIAPLLSLIVWRFSLHRCGAGVDPGLLLQTHFDLLLHGLCVQRRTP
ncbi:MAG: transcriptional regulator, TetR family [Proteobacteria bacterium]|nr:transcriptional regulator, TetR family [Pseudomonadota bacterium]